MELDISDAAAITSQSIEHIVLHLQSLRYLALSRCYYVTLSALMCVSPFHATLNPLSLFRYLGQFFCFSFVFRVYVVFCFLVFGCQCQCNRLPGKTHLQNDLLCCGWDVKPTYSLTAPLHYAVVLGQGLNPQPVNCKSNVLPIMPLWCSVIFILIYFLVLVFQLFCSFIFVLVFIVFSF